MGGNIIVFAVSGIGFKDLIFSILFSSVQLLKATNDIGHFETSSAVYTTLSHFHLLIYIYRQCRELKQCSGRSQSELWMPSKVFLTTLED